jgi:transposase
MSFRVNKEVNGTTYVYETTGYWDKDKKQSRHKRVYLGKLDKETGEIIPPKKNDIVVPKLSKNYGNFFVIDKIANNIGLTDILKSVFKDTWSEIITCAFYEICEKKPWYLIDDWMEETNNISKKNLNSQRISELLKSITEEDRMKFFRSWSNLRSENECIAFDITSISSYSKLIECVERGYNRDGENLPQINMGMLFGETSLLPIFYKIYPGSIKDVNTIANMLKLSAFLKIEKMKFVLDKGFFSESNIDNIVSDGKNYQFTVSVPFSTKFAKNAVNSVYEEIKSPINTIMVNSDIIQAVTKIQKWKTKRVYVHTYFNNRKHAKEQEDFLKMLLKWEKELKENSLLKSNEKKYKKYFTTRKTKNGISVKRKENAIVESLKNKGFLVILTNNIKSAEQALEVYRNKDVVEKAFDNIKNELDLERLRIHSDKAMDGRIFIAFISLIMQSHIHKVMKENNLYKKYTIEKLIMELKKIKIFELSNGKKMISEISKKQRDILKAFNISEIS